MEFFNTYFLDIIKNKYALFNGRARRKEFWMFYLVWVIIVLGISIIGIILSFIANFLGSIFFIINMLFMLGTIVPFVALSVRRVHDTNKDWWYIIIPVYNLILYIIEGDKGDNEYGPDPKAGE